MLDNPWRLVRRALGQHVGENAEHPSVRRRVFDRDPNGVRAQRPSHAADFTQKQVPIARRAHHGRRVRSVGRKMAHQKVGDAGHDIDAEIAKAERELAAQRVCLRPTRLVVRAILERRDARNLSDESDRPWRVVAPTGVDGAL